MSLLWTIWNGGLDPDTADPVALRERRTRMAGTGGGRVWYLHDNLWIGLGILGVLVGILVQAYLDRPRITAHACVLAYYLAPTVAMADIGLEGHTWSWLLGVPVVATLIAGCGGGLVWAAISISTFWLYGMEIWGARGAGGNSMLAQQTLLFVFVTLAAQGFRSSQRKAEAQMRQAIDRLETEVAARTRTEAEAREAARRALAATEAKARFLATMSHEVRTPINGVLGAAALLMDDEPDPRRADLLRIVEASGQSLLGLVNRVLDYSRLEAGRVTLEAVPVDPRALLRESFAAFTLDAAQRGLALDSDVAGSVPRFVEADPSALRQILTNLVGNAMKFTERGGVQASLRYADGRLRLEVRDSGTGIPEASLAELFDPFVQAEASTARRFGGSGLGLAIVRETVEAMGGTVEVRSTVGVGSTFTVALPLREAAAPESAPGRVVTPSLPPRRVLVVDDNQVNRLVASRMLERDGHVVVQAEDGARAIELLKAQPFDLVLMDVQMPEMDGFEATAALRAMPEARATPVVGLTASAMPGDRERVLSSGMNDYLAKPVRRDDLRAALARWSGPGAAPGDDEGRRASA